MLRAINASFILPENKRAVLGQTTGGAVSCRPLPTDSARYSLGNVINHRASPAEDLPTSARGVPLTLIHIKGPVMY